jgi:hypothetical protein
VTQLQVKNTTTHLLLLQTTSITIGGGAILNTPTEKNKTSHCDEEYLNERQVSQHYFHGMKKQVFRK